MEERGILPQTKAASLAPINAEHAATRLAQ